MGGWAGVFWGCPGGAGAGGGAEERCAGAAQREVDRIGRICLAKQADHGAASSCAAEALGSPCLPASVSFPQDLQAQFIISCALACSHPTPPRSEDGRHAVSYELGWRRLTDPGRAASRAVLGQLGDKLLSAVKYVHRGETFDSVAFPTQGERQPCLARGRLAGHTTPLRRWALCLASQRCPVLQLLGPNSRPLLRPCRGAWRSCTAMHRPSCQRCCPPPPRHPAAGWGYRSETQVAGLATPSPSVLQYVRQHLQGKAAFRIADGAALTLSAEAGLLLPWGACQREGGTPISDRFFLGGTGVGALRGFAQKGVGPSDARRPGAEVRGVGFRGGPLTGWLCMRACRRGLSRRKARKQGLAKRHAQLKMRYRAQVWHLSVPLRPFSLCRRLAGPAHATRAGQQRRQRRGAAPTGRSGRRPLLLADGRPQLPATGRVASIGKLQQLLCLGGRLLQDTAG